jgi:serine/threonine-protein kinase
VTESPEEIPAEGSEAARARAAQLVGRTISDRYKIINLLAMGGMGAVYRAEHLLMRKHVAVKVLHPETEGFPELVERFEREAVAGAHINHPNVASASDFGVFDGESRFLVLEHIRGVTLRELMNQGPLPPARSARIIRQIAGALAAVHRKGIVHRDIKPRNIMIIDETRSTRRQRRDSGGAEDTVKLIDFGLSKVPIEKLSSVAHEGDLERRSLTAAGVLMGTVGYLAPEAALGMRSVLAPADLYSVGVIFYEMLSGKPPFEAANDLEMFTQHRKKPVPPMSERSPGVAVPKELEDIARRLLEKDPDARYADATALVEALDTALGHRAIERAAPPPPLLVAPARVDAAPARAPAASRRGAWLAGLVVASGLVGVGLSRMVGPKALEGAVASSAPEAVTASPTTSSSAGTHRAPPRAPTVVDRLHAAAETQDSAAAAAAFLAIADDERAAFADRAVQTEAANVAELAAGSGRAGDAVFDRLATGLGTDGLDIVYDLAAREPRSGSPIERAGLAPPAGAGPRARAILGRPEALARATPAMRIAYELRRASCEYRPNLFPRAASDGDDRALQILTSMQPPGCSRKDACCFPKHRELERAIAEIQTRLRH